MSVGQNRGRRLRGKTIRYKINKLQEYKQPKIYKNYKWSITFKYCDSLCCTFVTYNIVHKLYFNKIF